MLPSWAWSDPQGGFGPLFLFGGLRQCVPLPSSVSKSMHMKEIVRILCITVLASLAVSTEWAYSASIVTTANAIEWTSPNIDRLKTLFNNADAVAALDKATAPQDYEADMDNIGDFRIVDLSNDGHLELVGLVDVTGRRWYTSLVIFSQQGSKIVRSVISTGGANIGSLDNRLVGLRPDGQKQLLIPRWLGRYEGASQPIAMFTDIYRFDSRELVRANDEFPEYYSTIALPKLRAKLDELEKQPNPGDMAAETVRQKKIAALQQEMDEIHRTIGR